MYVAESVKIMEITRFIFMASDDFDKSKYDKRQLFESTFAA